MFKTQDLFELKSVEYVDLHDIVPEVIYDLVSQILTHAYESIMYTDFLLVNLGSVRAVLEAERGFGELPVEKKWLKAVKNLNPKLLVNLEE